MISLLIKKITNKQIILFNKHRNVLPIVCNKENRSHFYFLDIDLFWRYIPFKTSDKRKHKIMYVLLNVINPKFIISMNWITARESLYKVWTAKHPQSKFIVVQHGAYVGGFVTNIPHRYTKCDVFLTWGSYFVDQFSKYNHKKKVQIICYGNPIYNNFVRENYQYKNNNSNKVLLLPKATDYQNLNQLYKLIKKLNELNFEVVIKSHGKQGSNELNTDGTLKYPKIKGVKQINGVLYPILQSNDYDFIISDHSSSLLDTIFFKNKVLYFDPKNKVNGYETNYSNFLVNLFEEDFSSISKNSFYELLSIENQEALLHNMIYMGNNSIDSKILSENKK
ncbi:hypothetical protein [Psychroflexus sp. MES1-P1E]|uniref:hypothetical protein n=1 Tax=Psychroflexus sp. MES1-P1E TaxID=2058320 RepID=UPI000C7C207E|nr:hypothetical protein [Psychroflexus sp. MES1-P1E]PKG43440.1 hypothetical protein CXF67_05080 [Psychroflexus sp. MES1-P1E]